MMPPAKMTNEISAFILAVWLLTTIARGVTSTGQRYTTSPAQDLDNTLQSVPPLGPNVCRSRYKNYCCPGWTKKPETGLCVIPICVRRCGPLGRCIRPNICLCEGGTVASSCTSSQTKATPTYETGNALDRGESGRCRVHCINGNCVDGKCQCRSGYQGEFCNEPICREPCLNQGRCIGPDRCACIYGYTGRRCETDYRTGPCYTKVKNGQCLANLQGVVCTRQLCCATVGKGWGHPCERCPARLDCELGHLKTNQGQCVDINECEAIPGLCEGGKCVNTQGSFTCECPDGQARDPETNSCKDKDECQEEGICADGRCINTNGGYYCLCNPGFIQSQDRRFCIDGRQGLCYTSVNRNGQCKNRLAMRLSKKDCCCGKNMGRGWGDECYICPNPGSDDYNRLCLQQLQPITEINECALRPDICGNGKCIDTKDGYECDCYNGFTKKGNRCEDIDECLLGYCQGGTCRNYEGSFSCQCPPGFVVSGEGRYCTDHDECQDTGMCNNGHCINMNGSFKCKCNDGYVLSPTRNTCIDINECAENPRICLNGRCENTPGSYHCICQPGFTPSRDNTFCVDMDECSTSGMCENGKCVNMEGSFKCVCDSGFRIGPDQSHCIDIDECLSAPCQNGRCINTPGSFRCECNPGFNLGPDGRSCLETRRDLCYSQYRDGQCSNPTSTAVTKSSCCCCTVILGQPMGWGTPCQPCPLPNTNEFDALCPHGAGMTYSGDDINECAQNPNICVNGGCENLMGTYRCICDSGYEVDATGKICSDINECELEQSLCSGGQCRNTPGSFQCICPSGMRFNTANHMCEDIDECEELGPGVCLNGICIDTLGSYECECSPGYILDHTGHICMDNRRGSCWTKMIDGRCEYNLPRLALKSECCCSVGVAWGSPCELCDHSICECTKGYAKFGGKECVDVNECELNSDICKGGGTCVNTDGSYRCECPPGLTLDATHITCIDTRQETCYLDYRHGQCTNPIEGQFSKSLCCCSVGRAWGSERCEACPKPGTHAHKELCPRGGGFTDKQDVNECVEFPGMCLNGRCKNTVGSFSCKCNQGFALDEHGIKCNDIDECEIMRGVCGNGTCRNTPGNFQCDCNPGYLSHDIMKICMDINECEETPGLCRGGTCINTEGSFKCQCPPGHELGPDKQSCKDIDECSRTSGICSNGVCENMMGTYQCICDDGYQQTGLKSHCEDINECATNNGGCEDVCLNTPGSFSCSCSTGFALNLDGRSCVDVDECKENPRICNGGKCTNIEGGYICTCTDGLISGKDGASCIDIDECNAQLNICGYGECYNTIGSYNCRCEEGYSVKPDQGPGCTDDDECLLNVYSCSEFAECQNTQGSYECTCHEGFVGNGVECRDINECLTNNGGCDSNAQCINTEGSFKCDCDAGFRGDGYTCKDIDECANDNTLCENGHCLNYPGSFRCECEMGFMHPDESNEQTCVDINECEMFSNLCVFGRCENIFGMFRCECHEGYKLDGSGGNCTDIDECENPQSCQYGTCVNTQGKYICKCPPYYELVEAGNACVDRRESFCFVGFEHGTGKPQCIFDMASSVTKATCCCSIGNAWGNRCEECPQVGTKEFQELCPGGSGYRPNQETVILEDINECEEYENICQNGHCTNTFGSFMCSCNEGFILDDTKSSCIDVNECALHPQICGVGHCINDQGKYHCECPEGYMAMPGGKECVDMRKESCYLNYESGECFNPMMHPQTKMLCCCSMGAAWGSPCEKCPAERTREHEILCGQVPGQIMNPITNHTEEIDECALMPTMCTHGRCMNTPGSFECQCDRGYVYDQDSHQCIDENECLQIPNPCSGNAQCINKQGYFECVCPAGYKLGLSQRDCVDIDECYERPGICNNGACNNLQGSFQCICHGGFALTRDRDNCVDIDECQRNPNICNNGTCVNTLGSYKCICYQGFKLSPNNDCADIDECRIMPFLCRNGRCRNTIGAFNCECADGYVLAQDGQHCRDIDECHEIPGLCPSPGKCQNLMGSYICTCPLGYELDHTRRKCVDVDECVTTEEICENGRCINTEGGVICECPVGYRLSDKPNSMRCIDVREDLCYDRYVGHLRGRCSFPRTGAMTKKHCCCTMGKAWGKYCEQCPPEDSEEFKRLCPEGPGRDDTGIDLNECLFMPDACAGGECINTDGSFRCECPSGYMLDASGRRCVDNNECLSQQNICGNGTCTNIEGGFECSCNEGFTPGVNQVCEDVNECLELGNQCAFRCHNAPGSFRCICPYGYTLAPDARHCIDVDECATPANNCKYQCKNLIGSFMCICPPGYQQIGMTDECKDVDECAINSGLCRNGQCVNVEGSYQCLCYDGFEQSPDGKSCIDRRMGYCFLQTIGGRCTARTSDLKTVTKADCCCTMGAAWGPHCEICPTKDSDNYNELCLDKGFSVNGQDIDECRTIPDLCKNGLCINTLGSYRCVCNKGYKADKSGTQCVDINECELTPRPCKYNCQNTEGSFICSCPAGFILNPDGVSCRDLDECATGNHLCQQNCINTQGSYTCGCQEGYTQDGDACHDINECDQPGTCPKPGTCINTLGSFRCICPRGFKLDQSGRFCIDQNECADDSTCEHGCQNFMGSYRCGCPEGFVQHLYYNQCIDENECNTSPCGDNTCINTIGSYKCGCPDGYQFDGNLQICVQVSAGCIGSPCAFGCTPNGANGFICGCPTGYQRIGQGHCLSTINPLSQGHFGEDISSAPTFVINPDPYHIPPADDKTISTEGCFSCKVNGKGRHRRYLRTKSMDQELIARRREIMKRRFVRSAKRHHHGEEYILKISLRQTRHRMRIIKLQPAVKDENMEYTIIKGNDDNHFEIVNEHGMISALHFRNRLKEPGQFRLMIHGRPRNGISEENEVWERPLTFRVHLIVTE
ncbi:fibrillin-2 [Apis mellifera]|uniref:Fibrillin-2 n=1 Tax=Apis mellifera TaxID=7460 RepID=A0A7M7MRJ5_APIME|nr:fibrillin-2 [Apis mellifera]XP_026299688.1 fibrillin-2 [Apis mellifera]|eukprot:XP_003250904.3 fibrillin-2 [Apis mellifera]